MSYADLLKQYRQRVKGEQEALAPQEANALDEAKKAEEQYALAKGIGQTASQLGNIPTTWSIMKGREAPQVDYSQAAELIKPQVSKKDILAKYDALRGEGRKQLAGADQSELESEFKREQSARDQALEMQKWNRQQDWDIKKMQMAAGIEAGKTARGEAKDLQKKTEETSYRAKSLNDNLDKLSGLIDKVGTFEMIGPESEQMDKIIYNVAVDYAKLVDPASVAREGEVAAAQKYMLPVQGLFKRNSTAQKLIADMKSEVDRREKTFMESRGSSEGSLASDEDKKAIEWAQKNPKDPRAQDILNLNKTQLAR